MDVAATYPKNAATNAEHPRPLRCDKTNPTTGEPCDCEFLHTDQFARHMSFVHDSARAKMACSICGGNQLFSHVSALRRHYRVRHPDQGLPGTPVRIRPYVCNTCHRSFRQKSHLRIHERTHTAEEGRDVHQCTQCSRTFLLKSTLILHVRRAHESSQGAKKLISREEATNSTPSQAGKSLGLDGTEAPAHAEAPGKGFARRDHPEDHIFQPSYEEVVASRDRDTDRYGYTTPGELSYASSVSSCDSGISHPPRKGGKRKKKVVAWPYY